MKLRTLVILFSVLSSIACSQRWIESDTGYSSDELLSEISSLTNNIQGSDAGSQELATFNSLVKSSTSSIYFVDGPSPMGQALSAVSFLNFEVMGRSDKSDFDLDQAIAVYVEDLTENGFESALFVQLYFEDEENPVTKVFASIEEPTIDDDKYVAFMGQNGNHQLTLETFYTEGGDLQSVIQFQVYEVINGSESWLGKFGAMVGYGG